MLRYVAVLDGEWLGDDVGQSSASKPGSTLSCRRIELNDLLFRCVR